MESIAFAAACEPAARARSRICVARNGAVQQNEPCVDRARAKSGDETRADKGDRRGAGSLLPLVYDELRAAAGRLMADERRAHTLQPTALVHEAYAKLAKAGCAFDSELHFFHAAAQAMRRILLDHALARGRQKRGGGGAGRRERVDLDDVNISVAESRNTDWLALEESLKQLEQAAPRQAQVVGLRFFAGLGDAKIANLLGVSEPTVRRDWAAARVWLYRQMSL